ATAPDRSRIWGWTCREQWNGKSRAARGPGGVGDVETGADRGVPSRQPRVGARPLPEVEDRVRGPAGREPTASSRDVGRRGGDRQAGGGRDDRGLDGQCGRGRVVAA